MPFLSVIKQYVFPKGVPLSPFPSIQKCLGLYPNDVKVQILEGFARIAYNFNVKPASEDCLFNVFENKEQRQKRFFDELFNMFK
jgi:hypothetical protein